MGKKKIERMKKQEKEKVQRKREEVFGTAGGFIFMGAYVLISGKIPSTLIGWAGFIGLFLLVSAVIYGSGYYLLKRKTRQQISEASSKRKRRV